MIQKMDGIIIRPLSPEDIDTIAVDRCPPWSTQEVSKTRWMKYYQEQQEGMRTVGVVKKDGVLLGYGSLLLKSEYPHFNGVPEISDVWIYEEYLYWLEELARAKGCKEIGIGFGLYADYGSAQKLYIHLGYSPDGHWVTYKYQPTTPGITYPLDDELILWLKKDLHSST